MLRQGQSLGQKLIRAQSFGKALAQLRELRRDHRHAIGIALAFALPIGLVIILGGIPVGRVFDRRDDRRRLVGLRARDPGARPRTVDAFRDSLEEYLSGSTRKRESRTIVAEVRKRLEDTSGKDNYQTLREADRRLVRALASCCPKSANGRGSPLIASRSRLASNPRQRCSLAKCLSEGS